MITVAAKDLRRILDGAAEPIETRNTIPILSHVRLIAGDGRLTAAGTDLDIIATSSCPASGAAAFCAAGDRMKSFAKLVGDGDVTLESDGRQVVVRAGRNRMALPILPVGDFPDMTAGDFDASFTVDAAEFGATLAATLIAHSTEETRYYLNGAFLHAQHGKLIAVATDGHKLMRIMRDCPDGAGAMPGIIIPTKAVRAIIKMAGRHDSLAISVSEAKIGVVAGDETMTSKLIDGAFPDYQRVIPTGNDKCAAIGRKALLAAIDIAGAAMKSANGMRFSFGGEGMILTARDPDGCESESRVEGVEWRMDPFEIVLNAAYVSGIVAAFPGDAIEWRMADAGSPLVIVAAGGDGDRTAVIMPMRV